MLISMTDSDLIHRFIFEKSDIRGIIVTLQESYQQVIQGHDYPRAIEILMGELLAAVGLLSTTLKFNGVITLQARGNGPLSMIMADCTRHHDLRGLAQFDKLVTYPENSTLRELLGDGHLTLTIAPARGERYQGIVALDDDSLARCLETYFERSEQLPTRLWLRADRQKAGGFLLQALPLQMEADPEENQRLWEHVVQLAETLKPEEQLGLAHRDQLYRLFHQDEIRLLEPSELRFCCSCSRERTIDAIRSVGKDEILKILAEAGEIRMDCHFCRHSYLFSESDIEDIFSDQPPILH